MNWFEYLTCWITFTGLYAFYCKAFIWAALKIKLLLWHPRPHSVFLLAVWRLILLYCKIGTCLLESWHHHSGVWIGCSGWVGVQLDILLLTLCMHPLMMMCLSCVGACWHVIMETHMVAGKQRIYTFETTPDLFFKATSYRMSFSCNVSDRHTKDSSGNILPLCDITVVNFVSNSPDIFSSKL